VSFNSEGGTGVADVSGLDGTTIALPGAPTRAGYSFAGWFLAASGGTPLTSPYTLGGSTTLFAQWTANPTDTVSFNSEGGTGVADVSGLDGTTIALPGAPTRAGYSFAGWNTAADGSGTAYAPGASYLLTGSGTLYAQWTANGTNTISFDANGGTGSAGAVSGLNGTTVTLPGGSGLSRAGYAFTGWNTAADGSGTAYAPGASYLLTGSGTLYAQWTANGTDTVSFNSNGGTGSAGAASGPYGSTVILASGSGLSRAGYSFTGWNTKADGSGTAYAPGASYLLTGSGTLYAQWAANAPEKKQVIGYWTVATDGGVFSFGQSRFYGSMAKHPLNKPVVGLVPTSDGNGYWLVASDGGTFSFGDAQFFGSLGNQTLTKPIVGMAATADSRGYWLVASDGGIFSFGDARFFGSLGNQSLTQPVVGMAATPDGRGYWLVTAIGRVYAFGDAKFFGPTTTHALTAPIVGIASTSDGNGYWLDASDGGVFAFGDAQFHGSQGSTPLVAPMVGISSPPGGSGYWTDASDGGIFTYGNARFFGSMGGQWLNAPMVGMATYAQ
jgi:uncharacterized repeat protein (TIGR02543 family)